MDHLRASLRILIAALLVAALSACSDESGTEGPDAGTEDTGEDVDEGDVGEGDTAADTTTDPGIPRACIPGTRRCVSDAEAEVCNDDSEWVASACGEEQLCWGGECGDIGTCEPNAVTRCIGFTRYEGCNPVGTGVGEFEVDFNLTCIEGEDGPELATRLCLEGETTCQDEQVLLRCAESGLEFEFSTNCLEDDETTLCDDNQCITLCQFIEKRETYVGCEYWAVDLDNYFGVDSNGNPTDAYFAQFAVAISNPTGTLAADVTIESATEVLGVGTVDPGDMIVFRLPPSEIDGTMVGPWGYRITSTVPIVAYQFNPLENEQVFSNDASLLLPTSSLGTEYYVMTRHQVFEDTKAFVTVVATQSGETVVTIQLPEATGTNPVITLAGAEIPPLAGGDEVTVTLQQFDTLNLETNRIGSDLTGTYISSDRPVAVLAGAECADVPSTDNCIFRERQADWVCEYDRETPCFDPVRQAPSIELCFPFRTGTCDHIEQQMLPVFAWGREFNAARTYQRRTEGETWRVLAAENNTRVTLVGLPTSETAEPPFTRTTWTIDEGEWFEFTSWSDFQILATDPIFVGQFLHGLHGPDDSAPPPNDPMNGDPSFIMAVPIEQYRDDYIFLVPGEYAHNFVTIVAPVGLDVNHVDEQGEEVFEADSFTPFGDGTHASLRVELEHEGYHRLSGEQPFAVTVYGFDDDVSYGYPAGLDIKRINRRRQ
jgi:hypothetical protein